MHPFWDYDQRFLETEHISFPLACLLSQSMLLHMPSPTINCASLSESVILSQSKYHHTWGRTTLVVCVVAALQHPTTGQGNIQPASVFCAFLGKKLILRLCHFFCHQKIFRFGQFYSGIEILWTSKIASSEYLWECKPITSNKSKVLAKRQAITHTCMWIIRSIVSATVRSHAKNTEEEKTHVDEKNWWLQQWTLVGHNSTHGRMQKGSCQPTSFLNTQEESSWDLQGLCFVPEALGRDKERIIYMYIHVILSQGTLIKAQKQCVEPELLLRGADVHS